MTDSHALIIREIDLQALRYLFRTPRSEPLTVRPVRLAHTLPRRGVRTGHDLIVLVVEHPGKPILHVLSKA